MIVFSQPGTYNIDFIIGGGNEFSDSNFMPADFQVRLNFYSVLNHVVER